MELRPPQQFSRAQQVDVEDPDISLPVTYNAGTEGALQRLQGEGAGQGQAHIRHQIRWTDLSSEIDGVSCLRGTGRRGLAEQ